MIFSLFWASIVDSFEAAKIGGLCFSTNSWLDQTVSVPISQYQFRFGLSVPQHISECGYPSMYFVWFAFSCQVCRSQGSSWSSATLKPQPSRHCMKWISRHLMKWTKRGSFRACPSAFLAIWRHSNPHLQTISMVSLHKTSSGPVGHFCLFSSFQRRLFVFRDLAFST